MNSPLLPFSKQHDFLIPAHPYWFNAHCGAYKPKGVAEWLSFFNRNLLAPLGSTLTFKGNRTLAFKSQGKALGLERSVRNMDVWEIDIGGTVVCDFCNDDYTESDMQGGLIIDGYAVCPRCEKPEMIKEATHVCRTGESFRQFVLRNRENNKIGVYSW